MTMVSRMMMITVILLLLAMPVLAQDMKGPQGGSYAPATDITVAAPLAHQEPREVTVPNSNSGGSLSPQSEQSREEDYHTPPNH